MLNEIEYQSALQDIKKYLHSDKKEAKILCENLSTLILPEEHFRQAQLFFMQAKIAEETKEVKKFCRLASQALTKILGEERSARYYELRGDIDKTLNLRYTSFSMYQRVLKIEPSNTQMLNYQGRYLVLQGKFDEAIHVLERSLTIERSPVTLKELASVESVRGEYQASLRYLREAIALDPENPRLYDKLGHILRVIDSNEEAMLALEKARALYRSPSDTAHAEKKLAEVKDRYEQQLKESLAEPSEKTILPSGRSKIAISFESLLFRVVAIGRKEDVAFCLKRLKEKEDLLSISAIHDDTGNTLLHKAAEFGRTHLIDELISEGLNIDIVNISGETPFDIATKHGYWDMMRMLVSKGADIKKQLQEFSLHIIYVLVNNMIEENKSGGKRSIEKNQEALKVFLIRQLTVRPEIKFYLVHRHDVFSMMSLTDCLLVEFRKLYSTDKLFSRPDTWPEKLAVPLAKGVTAWVKNVNRISGYSLSGAGAHEITITAKKSEITSEKIEVTTIASPARHRSLFWRPAPSTELIIVANPYFRR